ncbi:PREDICTED: uncharacterized protein LOC108977076 [Bactrocera latifrons]|uniref:uncharacterized protein LOC108977076 n=1 Tax=Bactrocera latifrons TaxID=174628 RepID=UPI0008DC6594|nr:PREDICTED: uncharacterized protein LOC108977076 [Bactrocera latifrons]
MDISVDLYYNDENIGGKIDVLSIRKSFRDRSNPLELPNAKSIRYVDARHAGANHDSFVFNASDTWILGDAGYPLHIFLMPPYRLAEASSPQYSTLKGPEYCRADNWCTQE